MWSPRPSLGYFSGVYLCACGVCSVLVRIGVGVRARGRSVVGLGVGIGVRVGAANHFWHERPPLVTFALPRYRVPLSPIMQLRGGGGEGGGGLGGGEGGGEGGAPGDGGRPVW